MDAFTHWWAAPRAVELDGITYVGVVGNNGDVSVVSVASGEPTRTLVANTPGGDDHHAPAILVSDDTAPIVAWSRHNDDSLLRFKIGATGQLPSYLDAEVTETFPNAVSYQQVFAASDGTIYAFVRRLNRYWDWSTSTDGGATWGTTANLLDFGVSQQGYMIARQDGDVLHVAMFGNPINSDMHDISYMDIDLDTGAITEADGTSIGNLDGTSLPLSPEAIDLAHDAGVSGVTRLYAVGGGLVAFASWTDGDQTATRRYRVAEWGGSSWATSDLGDPGVALDEDDNATQYGGIDLAADGALYVSRETSGTWTIERWADSGGWAIASTVASSAGDALARPICPVGRSVGPPVVWFEVSDYTSATNWTSDLAIA